MIRYLVEDYTQPIPAVLEIPSKDCPYDASKDSILARVQHLMGAQDF
jgi:V-type H+-transporting ATPase subunit F